MQLFRVGTLELRAEIEPDHGVQRQGSQGLPPATQYDTVPTHRDRYVYPSRAVPDKSLRDFPG
jgi:hypothetical protein